MEDVKSKVAIPMYKAGIASEPNSTHEATVVVTSWGPLKNTKLIDVAERTSAAPSYFAASKGYLDGTFLKPRQKLSWNYVRWNYFCKSNVCSDASHFEC